jgi:hypothetical protein
MRKLLLGFILTLFISTGLIAQSTRLEIPIVRTENAIDTVYLEDDDDIVYDTVIVELSYDDAEEENGEIDALNDDDLDFGWQGDPEDLNVQTVGLRFLDVQVPVGATIDSAYLLVTSHEAKAATDVAIITIVADANDDPPTFSEDSLITDRARTTASVAWTIEEEWGLWTTEQSVDFSPVVQEIVDRPGWQPGNAMAIILLGSDEQGASEDDNAREIESFENISDPGDGGDGVNHPERVPKLVIKYSTGTGIESASANTIEFSVFPNPANSDFINIQLSQHVETEIGIFNVNGQLLSSETTKDDLVRINIESFAKGVYVVQVSNSFGIASKKLIIE